MIPVEFMEKEESIDFLDFKETKLFYFIAGVLTILGYKKRITKKDKEKWQTRS